MRKLSLEIELTKETRDAESVATRVSARLREALSLKIPVQIVEPGTLPRFEMKARRFIVQDTADV